MTDEESSAAVVDNELVPVEMVTIEYVIDEDGVTEIARETTRTAYVKRSQLAGFDESD